MDRGSFAMRPCAFQDVQAVEARSRHAFPRHTHDSYGIGLIVRGAQRSWSGRGTVEAGRGNIITCNPGEVHDGVPIGDTRE
jgi:quercetin dioxygenase-like cupin family protein